MDQILLSESGEPVLVPAPVEYRILSIGDVVEFTHNGAHEKAIGFVFFDIADKKRKIQCADYVTGIGNRRYKILYNVFEKQDTDANTTL